MKSSKTRKLRKKTAPARKPKTVKLDATSKQLRRQIIEMLSAAQRGHLGSAFSLVEILRALYENFLRFDPKDPHSTKRDRFILSKGHGCLALYAVLAQHGFFESDILKTFCQHESILGGHPEYGKIPGVEASTGSLGHGLSIAVGMALAAKLDKAKHRIVVVGSDGECNEGSTWEAALCAAKHKLNNLTLLIDYNKQQSYSSTFEVLDLEPLVAKWKAFNFEVREVDGHDFKAISRLLKKLPFSKTKPSLIVCHTVKGKGVSFAENNPAWHHKVKIKPEEVQAMLTDLDE